MYPDNGQNWGQSYPGHRPVSAQHQWGVGTGWNPPVPLPGLMPNDRPARHSWEIPLLVVAIVLTVVAYVAAIAALFLGVVSTWVLIVLVAPILIAVGRGQLYGSQQVNGIKMTPTQFPDGYRMVAEAVSYTHLTLPTNSRV